MSGGRSRTAERVVLLGGLALSMLAACGALIGLPSSVEVTSADASGEAPRDGRLAERGTESGDAAPMQNVVDYCLGYGWACAIIGDGADAEAGAVYCWGATCNPAETPFFAGADDAPRKKLEVEGGLEHLSCGFDHACAWTRKNASESSVYCWGRDQFGQVTGVPRESGSDASYCAEPTKIGGANVTIVAAGDEFTCVLRAYDTESHVIECQGDLAFVGPVPPSLEQELFDSGSLAPGFLVAGGAHVCLSVTEGGGKAGLICWLGDPRYDVGQLGTAAEAGLPEAGFVFDDVGAVKSLAAGAGVTCYLDQEYTAHCAGVNASGQLGGPSDDCDGSSGVQAQTFEALPSGAGGIVSLAPGGATTCVVTAAAAVAPGVSCFGDNSSCQLGYSERGACVPYPPEAGAFGRNPVDLPGIAPRDVRVSRFPHCYVGDAGSHTAGFAEGYPDEACLLARACPARKRAFGLDWVSSFACARGGAVSDGHPDVLMCWGSNSQGELGRGEAGAPSAEPSLVIGPAR